MELRWKRIKGLRGTEHGIIGLHTVFLVYPDRKGIYQLDKPYYEGESFFNGTLEECKVEALRLLTTSA